MNEPLPSYHLDRVLFTQFVLSALVGIKRSFRQDALRFMKGVTNFKITGVLSPIDEYKRGCLLVFNHYSRPGFATWWRGLSLAASLPKEAKFVVASSYTYPDTWLGRQKTQLWKWILKRVAETYNFIGMPAMPPKPEEILERSNSVRNLIQYARSTPQPWIAFAPEGGDSSDGRLAMPYPGVGRLMEYISGHLGLTIQPVGLFEEAECLWVFFGDPYCLDPSGIQSSKDLDRVVSLRIMQSIASCLPDRFWSDEIQGVPISR